MTTPILGNPSILGLVSRARLFFPPPQIKTEKSGLARETILGCMVVLASYFVYMYMLQCGRMALPSTGVELSINQSEINQSYKNKTAIGAIG